MWPVDQIRTWLRRAQQPSEYAKNAAESGYSALMSTYGTPNAEKVLPTFEQYAASGYGGNAAIFSVMDRRNSVFCEATFKYRQLSDKKLFGNTSLAKLEQPWPDGTTGDLLARMLQDVDLAGNAYVRDAGDRLERLRPDWVTIISRVIFDEFGHELREVIGYAYDPIGDPGRSLEFYTVEEVAHWAPKPDPLANFSGMSPMTPILREINADVRMSQFRDAFFENAATPNIVVRYNTELKPGTIERLLTMIDARHTGPANAFNSLVLDQGADLTIVGANMEGSAFNDLQAAGESRIAAAFGVPALIAGFREGMQASQIGEYQQAMRAFADMTMRPLWRSACAALAKLVEVPAGAQLWYDVTDVSALRQGEKDAADTMVQLGDAFNKFYMAGCEPQSIVAALVSGDMTLIKHNGRPSVQTLPASFPETGE